MLLNHNMICINLTNDAFFPLPIGFGATSDMQQLVGAGVVL